jgi:hypothetical protein
VKKIMITVSVFLFVVCSVMLPQMARADVELKVLQNLDLKVNPLDVVSSADGQRLFILTPGEILVYSLPEGRISDHVAVDRRFDHIASSPRPDVLTVSSSTKKNIQVVMLESIHKIDVSGLPFQGPKDAPVTIAVFDDYQ